jgi:hypothetical protein
LRLKPDQKIAGCAATQVRALLRRLNQDFWTVETAARVLKVPVEQARRTVYSLRRLGYVEVVSQQRPGTWRNTMAGNALANATAAAPISRTQAHRLLTDFLVRVKSLNSDKSQLFRVGKVVVFGSYLSGQQWLNDVDLAIRLDRRPEFAECWPEAVLARAEAEEKRGRRFRGFLDGLAWPEADAKRYLRGGTRSLSLHNWTKEEPWLQHAAHKVLFQAESSKVPAQSGNQKSPDACTGSHDRDSTSHRSQKRPRRCPF